MGLLSLAVIYPLGNVSAVDSYLCVQRPSHPIFTLLLTFDSFGASASTESGLNT